MRNLSIRQARAIVLLHELRKAVRSMQQVSEELLELLNNAQDETELLNFSDGFDFAVLVERHAREADA